MTTQTRHSSIQPACNDCWNTRNPERPATRVAVGPDEECCYCAAPTRSGIYVRVDPAAVLHPTLQGEPA